MSSRSTSIQFKSILHQLLKMTTFCSNTGGESRTPLIYRFVYDVLSNAVPHTQHALTQLVDVIYAFLVDPLLHYSPYLNPRGSYLDCLGGHWSGEIKSGVSRRKSAIVSSSVMRPVRICTVLLEYEIVTVYFLDEWQQLLLQQYFTIIVGKVSK